MGTTVTPQRLEREVFARIPLAAAMHLRVNHYVPEEALTLAAPFEPNTNHAGFGFGGAIECIGTLACWGLVWLTLDHPEAAIVIQHAETDFLSPIRGELIATVQAPDADIRQHFLHSFAAHGKGRIDLTATVGTRESSEAARFHGRFIAKRKP
jgi:thioesterase domain-containing protein